MRPDLFGGAGVISRPTYRVGTWCPRCGDDRVRVERVAMHTELYCASACGWIKWAAPKERRALRAQGAPGELTGSDDHD